MMSNQQTTTRAGVMIYWAIFNTDGQVMRNYRSRLPDLYHTQKEAKADCDLERYRVGKVKIEVIS